MNKIIALSVLLLCVSFAFAEDITLSLEKLYKQDAKSIYDKIVEVR